MLHMNTMNQALSVELVSSFLLCQKVLVQNSILQEMMFSDLLPTDSLSFIDWFILLVIFGSCQ